MTELRETPLAARHVELGARMVPFAGYSMPVQYSSILEEHAAARERAALFDVSHMGQLVLRGSGAAQAAGALLSRPMADLGLGRIRYALLCNERGGTIDDLTAYRTGADEVLLCVNAANTAEDRDWIAKQLPAGIELIDESASTGLLALQGPASAAILDTLGASDATALRRFRFARVEIAGAAVLTSRTGYTGADGFELYCDSKHLNTLFEALLEAGQGAGLVPAGLGARDTLRLEAALPLHGHELDADTSPLEAGLGRFVELKHEFIGVEALRRLHEAGPQRQLVGFEVEGRGVARAGHPVHVAGRPVGIVTSGAPSPTLGRPIGLAYVPPAHAALGTDLEIALRGRSLPARVVATPFVTGARAGRPPH